MTTFTATDPRTGRPGAAFTETPPAEVAAAAAAAAVAHLDYRGWPADRVAGLLRGVADRLEALGDGLIDVAEAETALGATRLRGERARTCAQLRAFADLVEDGWHLEAVIDTADPEAQPVPRPDVRRMLIPVGPVAVFGASNFPLAFSVPGGDTASALAARCPVVVKAHPSHPGTSELCGQAISEAVDAAGGPPGLFALVHGPSAAVGEALVTAPEIAAVGFTGSLAGGRSLYDLGAARPEPIPVYAEMGSLNPLFITPAAVARRGGEIAEGFVGSMTLGVGQFCTKPGLVFVPGPEADEFADAAAMFLEDHAGGPLLNSRIRDALTERLDATMALPGVDVVVRGGRGDGEGFTCTPSLLRTDWDVFASTPALSQEHFGPVALVVRVPDGGLADAAREMRGSLTAAVHAEPEDRDDVAALERILRERAGRVIYDGFPTGVAVTHAMQHGGPYPATTFPAHTSVGSTAIRRWLRPVAYQNLPDDLLPEALQDANPLGLRRLVNGEWTDAALG